MIDNKGFRENVGIVLVNDEKQVFWGRRQGEREIWQFPQGGIEAKETPREAMYRELYEELGLLAHQVEVWCIIERWLYYYIPPHIVDMMPEADCIGQKQKWFLLRFMVGDEHIALDRVIPAEFSCFKWVDIREPLRDVARFKKAVYKQVLQTFAPFLINQINSDSLFLHES